MRHLRDFVHLLYHVLHSSVAPSGFRSRPARGAPAVRSSRQGGHRQGLAARAGWLSGPAPGRSAARAESGASERGESTARFQPPHLETRMPAWLPAASFGGAPTLAAGAAAAYAACWCLVADG